MVFIILPLFYIYFVFLTYELVVKLAVVIVVVGHLQVGKERRLNSEGGWGSVLFVVYVGGSANPRVCDSALRQVFFCSGRTLVGGTHAWWR